MYTMKKLFYLFIGFAILACSEEDDNTSADSGIFYETHGGKLFAVDGCSEGYNPGVCVNDAFYIPISQPEQDGESIINLWQRIVEQEILICAPFAFGFNNGYDAGLDCDIESKITQQSENKLIFTYKSLESYNSEPVTQETLELSDCNYDFSFTLEIKDDILTSTSVDNNYADEPTIITLRLANDWDVSNACPGNNGIFD